MFKRLAAALLAVLMLSAAVCASPDIGVSASSAILIDADSGTVLYEKNADKRMSIASTTKIMTAITAIESGINPERVITITKPMTGVEGSSIYLYPGEKLTYGDLIYAVLLESANDAATALAIVTAGSVDSFAAMMNDKAQKLGLKDSAFKNPHGLDVDGHYMSAHNLAVLSAYALKNDTFREIVSTKRKTIPLRDGQGTRLLRNHNRLLSSYEGCIGVKTGFTKKSGRCLVTAANRGTVTLVCVTLNASSDWADHTCLLDYGFESFERIEIAAPDAISFDIEVTGGQQGYACVSNRELIYAILPKGFDVTQLERIVELPRFLYAPVREGYITGRLLYKYEGKIICEGSLVVSHDVDMKNKFNWWEKLFWKN